MSATLQLGTSNMSSLKPMITAVYCNAYLLVDASALATEVTEILEGLSDHLDLALIKPL
jgi:hypothetical protein